MFSLMALCSLLQGVFFLYKGGIYYWEGKWQSELWVVLSKSASIESRNYSRPELVYSKGWGLLVQFQEEEPLQR